MGQDPLFDRPVDRPRERLRARLHEEVFGGLPALTARALDDPAVAGAVRPLLERGWRPAQLGARVGALPVSGDPLPAVVAFLEQLLERESPQHAWERERAEREQRSAEAEPHRVASEQERAHWVAQARRSLGMPPLARPEPAPEPARRCASCSAEAAYFVTRTVRLCAACVAALESGRARLAVGA